MSNADRDYYTRRHQQCLERANTTTDPMAASVHRELAAGYARKLAQADRGGLRTVASA